MKMNDETAIKVGCLAFFVIAGVLFFGIRSCSKGSSASSHGVPAGHTRKESPKSQYGETKKVEEIREEKPEEKSVYESQYERVPRH